MQKVVITGHTQGLGAALYNKFKSLNYQVVGLSRSNGYNITENFDAVVQAASGANIFINNAYHDAQQINLLHALKDSVDMMVVMGSITRLYPVLLDSEYTRHKKDLADACFLESIKPNSIPILHLDLSFLKEATENTDPLAFKSDYNTPLDDIVETILFWTKMPTIRNIEFSWKLTDVVKSEIARLHPDINLSDISKLINTV
jgi:hypothetical protein